MLIISLSLNLLFPLKKTSEKGYRLTEYKNKI